MPTTPVYTARIDPAGPSFEAPSDQPLLLSAEQSGVPSLQMTSSCRNGTCRTCICLLISGQVSYRIKWPGLSFDEKNGGYILPCVAYPASDVVMQLPF